MVSMMELFFQAPLCVLTFYAYHRQCSWRRVLEIVVGVLHVAGVWFMYAPVPFKGFSHLPFAQDPFLSFNKVFYVHFGFWFCGALWTFIPLHIAYTAASEIAEHTKPISKRTD
mmetsp:Transcript_70727/g.166789  ORF Transcript_70727/g.166789 Transcript_70727/m.166789 type:complete len:113 (+) Transcript_70727:388-726(+)